MSFGNKKLVIYSAANAHGYITCVVHRLLYNSDSYCVYIGDDIVAPRTGGIAFFDDSILYKQIAGEWGNMNELTPEEYERYLVKTFDGDIVAHNFRLNCVDEFFIGSNWSDFAIYLNLKNIHYNVFEEAIGDLGLPKESWAKRYPCQFAARAKTGMFAGLDNPHILKAYLHPKTLSTKHDKVVFFDVIKEIKNLPDSVKNKVATTFKVPQSLDDKEICVLLLTQWFRKNNDIWKSAETLKIYAHLLDLYFGFNSNKYHIVIKPHPVDPQRSSYGKYLNECFLLDSKFPSEFIGLVGNLNIDIAVTVSSSSISTVSTISKKQLSIKFFEQFYTIAPQFYFCARIIKLLSLKCFYFGIFKEVMEPLVSQNKGFLPDSVTWHRIDEAPLPEEGGLILYDNIWREGIVRTSLSKLYNSPDNSLCFIVTDNIENFIQNSEDATYTDYLFKLSLAIRPYADNSIYSTSEEKYIYIFSKNKDLISKLKNLNLTMVLPFSKIILMEGQLDQGDMPLQLKQNFILKNLNK